MSTSRVNEVEVEGLKEIHELFKRLPAELGAKALRASLRNAAKVTMYEAARSRAPQRHGTLRDSIKIKIARSIDLETAHVYINTTVHWGRMLENGTRKMSAHPWLGPAFDSSTSEFIDVFMTEAGKQADRVFKNMKPETLGETFAEATARRQRRRSDVGKTRKLKGEHVKSYFTNLRSSLGEEGYHALGGAQVKAHRKAALREAREKYDRGSVR